jgi:hypothetical protein
LSDYLSISIPKDNGCDTRRSIHSLKRRRGRRREGGNKIEAEEEEEGGNGYE